ncbi:MAG TPA: oxidoreductase [Sphingomicrobium sp.]|nr:oxidoreductase [Sphingomicrobium sp.]
MIRVGLIGYGLAGAVFHEPLIQACDGLELAAVLTSRDHPLRAGSMDHLLERCELVVIASPNRTHFPHAKAALEQGRHVVIDKPFTVTLAEADELIRIARERERVLTVFHNRRWDGDFLTVEKIMPELGQVVLLEAHWDRFRPAIKPGWREEAQPGAGLFNDLGPHMVDQALRLFGMPEAISADIAAQREGAKVDDFFDVRLHYGRMRACLRASTLVAAARPRFAVHGTSGSFVKNGLDPQEAQLKSGTSPGDPNFGEDSEDGELVSPDGSRRAVPTARGNYPAFYEGVAAAILDGVPEPVPAGEARDGLLLIDLARRAAASGQRLAVPGASSPEG